MCFMQPSMPSSEHFHTCYVEHHRRDAAQHPQGEAATAAVAALIAAVNSQQRKGSARQQYVSHCPHDLHDAQDVERHDSSLLPRQWNTVRTGRGPGIRT